MSLDNLNLLTIISSTLVFICLSMQNIFLKPIINIKKFWTKNQIKKSYLSLENNLLLRNIILWPHLKEIFHLMNLDHIFNLIKFLLLLITVIWATKHTLNLTWIKWLTSWKRMHKKIITTELLNTLILTTIGICLQTNNKNY